MMRGWGGRGREVVVGVREGGDGGREVGQRPKEVWGERTLAQIDARTSISNAAKGRRLVIP